ncbi:MAG: hypothetical protein P1U69_00605 [Parvibaculaceae bacterium]|jgi:mRNA-degrading endonuclease RelE of RelBE toxin-antitoxin system|nr:hypothetical protein [Parvibaculaceae bacterium]HBM88331.1 hypothetical protein [Rhodobiaceae bacterium]|tara:strand:+ start:653 stop:946 length:294 start_codon:yes stop_codon:yes gene_type:complete
MENVAYFGGAENAHGIAYSRSAFHQMSRLTKHHRSQLKDALMSMRSDDSNDEVLTGSRRTRRLDDGLRFVFERNGSALTVLAITDAGFPPQAKDIPP